DITRGIEAAIVAIVDFKDRYDLKRVEGAAQ
ncbi:pyroglutamyl-peptidase I, partial [Streptococcus pyogenes]